MNTKLQKKLAGKLLKMSKKKVVLDPARQEDIKEAITKADVRGLVKEGVIQAGYPSRNSRHRARKRQAQRNKGLRKGTGKRKGSFNARADNKLTWMRKTRLQRELISELKKSGAIDNASYRILYSKIKGGYFRSKRHIKLFISENDMLKKVGKSEK